MESRPGRFFLLKKLPQSLKSAESYLSRQGWKFSSGCTVKEALDEMMREPHPIALVPVDHSHGRLPELIGLLKRYFQCQVIVYAEVPSPQCMRALEDLPIERKIFPPLIGRIIERELLNAFRDLQSKKAELPASITAESEVEARQAQQRLFEKMQSDQLVIELLQEQKTAPESEVWHQKGNASTGDLGFLHQKGSGSLTDQGLLHQQGEEGADSELFLHKSQNPDAESNLLNKGAKLSKPSVAGSEADNSQDSNEMMHIKGKLRRRKGPQGEDVPDPDRELMHLKGGAKAKLSPQAGETPEGKGPELQHLHAKDTSTANPIQAVTGEFKEATQLPYPEPLETPLQQLPPGIHEMLCLRVKSRVFEGYLVAASNVPLLEEDFLEKLRFRMREALKSFGDSNSPEEDLELPIEFEIDLPSLEAWAQPHAEFLKRAADQGTEIAMAFFPSTQVEPRAKESGQEMLPVRIEDILPDERVDFDVFLHLSQNDRYLLYTPQGQIFGAQQKARLEAKGVRKLHVKKKALHRLKKYQAQNFLDSLLRNFKNQKKSAG